VAIHHVDPTIVRADAISNHVVALHELESLAGFQSDPYKAALSTPWRLRVTSAVVRRERYIFELVRGFMRTT